MKFKSAVYTQASGSVGGLTYSHNRGGMYTRARRIPVNVNTVEQQAVRNALSQAVTAWKETLTAPQRADWATYATNTPMVNRMGDAIDIGALPQYVRANVTRLQAGLDRVDAGPTTYGLPTFTTPTFTVDASNDTVSVDFTNTDDWATEVGGAMLVYASRPQSSTINSYKGPYRYAGKVSGAGTPPTSPETLDLPYPVIEGQKIFLRVVVVRTDGRVSSPFRDSATATA